MSLEATLKTLLGPLVGGRCYPDTAPDGAAFPLIIYQQVGGEAVEFLDQTVEAGLLVVRQAREGQGVELAHVRTASLIASRLLVRLLLRWRWSASTRTRRRS